MNILLLLSVTVALFNEVSASCVKLPGKDFYGSDVANKPASNADACCNHCQQQWNCIAWTWSTAGTCWMKDNINSITSTGSNVISGIMTTRSKSPFGIFNSGGTCQAGDRRPNTDASAGKDINSVIIQLNQESDCCQLCSLWTPRCLGYVWNHAQNHCWLKGVIENIKPNSIADLGIIRGTGTVNPPAPTGGSCTQLNGKDIPGNDITSKSASSADQCCSHCQQQSGCIAWTWSPAGKCWMKNKVGTIQASGSTVVSGIMKEGTVPVNTPAPPPPITKAPVVTQPPTSGLSGWKKAVLDRHNALRSKVAYGKQSRVPAAAYMARMKWDEGIAARAQAKANACNRHHENPHPGYGENVAAQGGNPKPSGNQVVMTQRWYDEVNQANIANYGGMTNTEIRAAKIGHYTQLIWSTSDRVGCGYNSNCAGRLDGGMSELLICQYMVSGNMFGTGPGGSASIFVPGATCSRCSGTCTDGLCDGPKS